MTIAVFMVRTLLIRADDKVVRDEMSVLYWAMTLVAMHSLLFDVRKEKLGQGVWLTFRIWLFLLNIILFLVKYGYKISNDK